MRLVLQGRLIFCFLFALVLYSFYLEYIEQLAPCPLCLMQRLCYMALMFIFLGVVCIKRSSFRIALNSGALLITGVGLFLSGRQLWLQQLPEGMRPSCAPGLDFMLKYMPFSDMMHVLLWGSGDCAKVQWEFLGLSLAAWSFMAFLLVLIATCVALFYLARQQGVSKR